MAGKEKQSYYFINSLAKATKILELLAETGELSVSEIGKKLGMHRSATHRFLATLRELAFLEQSEHSRYRLSFKLFELGTKGANRLEVTRVAHPFLLDIASRHEDTANLGIMDNTDVIYVDKVESPHLLRMDFTIGHRVPAYCTAMGKAILANRPETEVQKLFRGVKFENRTPKTILSLHDLLQCLRTIREEGYAVDDEELSLGTRCIASPIFDFTGRCVAAISIAGPTLRITYDKIEQIRASLSCVSSAISMRLGHKG